MTLEPLQSCLFLHCSRCIALVTEHVALRETQVCQLHLGDT